MRSKYALRFIALGYLALLLGVPVVLVFVNAFEDGIGAAWDAVTTPEAQHAFWLTIVMVAVAVPLNTIFGVLAALVLVRQRFRGKRAAERADRPAVRGLAGGGRPRAAAGLRPPRRLVRRLARRARHPGHLLDARHDPGDMFVSLPFVVREVIPVLREIGTEQEQAAATLGAGPLQTFFRITLPGDPLGRGLRRRADHRPRARRVRRGERRVRQAVRPDRDRHAVRGERVPELRRDRAPTLPRSCWRCWRSSTLLAMNLIKPKEAQG